MKLSVLILHQAFEITDTTLSTYRLYISDPHIVCTLDEALARLNRNQYSLIVVEVTPPWKFGAEPLVILRAATDIPILALLRGRNIDDFRNCREMANDCVWEPFDPNEIIARGLALVEHGVFNNISTSAITHIYCRGLLILPKYRRVYVDKYEVKLARKEYGVLLFMAQHKEQVLSKEQIYASVWHDDYIENIDGTVSYHIHSIRKKLSIYSEQEFIENVWGEGYRFCMYEVNGKISKCI